MRRHIFPSSLAPLPLSALASALLACAALLLPALVLASTSPLLSDAEQAELSTAVVVAEVEEARLGVDERWDRGVARTSLRVVEVLAGQAPESLVVEQFVGRQGDRVYRMPGDARLSQGERCVLFLREVGGHWYLTAMQLSKYSVLDTASVPRIRRVMTGGIFGGADHDSAQAREHADSATLRTLEELRSSLSSRTPSAPTSQAPPPSETRSGLSSGGDA